jgi:hypothetical protein
MPRAIIIHQQGNAKKLPAQQTPQPNGKKENTLTKNTAGNCIYLCQSVSSVSLALPFFVSLRGSSVGAPPFLYPPIRGLVLTGPIDQSIDPLFHRIILRHANTFLSVSTCYPLRPSKTATDALTQALCFFDSSISAPITSGLRGSTYADSLSSPHRAPIDTQTCLAGIVTFLVSRMPVHRRRLSRVMSLLPMPPLAVHSRITSRMNSTLRRNWFAAGMPWRSGLISGRRRVGLLVLRLPARGAGCLAVVWKFRSVWSGYERTVRLSRADSTSCPVSSRRVAAS